MTKDEIVSMYNQAAGLALVQDKPLLAVNLLDQALSAENAYWVEHAEEYRFDAGIMGKKYQMEIKPLIRSRAAEAKRRA
jgi:hypothetical protein